MKPSDALSKDARALLRAARGGDDIPTEERQRVLQAFRSRIASDAAVDAAGASAPRLQGVPAWRGGQRRALPRPVRRLAWALAAAISTGSLAALAHEGVFEGWGEAIEKMFGTLVGESSTSGREPASETPAAHAPTRANPSTPSVPPERSVASEPNVPPESSPSVPSESSVPSERSPRMGLEPSTPSEPSNPSEPSVPSEPTAAKARELARAANDPMLAASSLRAISATTKIKARRPQASAASSREPARATSAEPSRAPRPAPPPHASEELDLIITARNALATGRHSDARAAAERHARQFPSGVFGEEREAILALCACRETGASDRARRFIKRRPDSLFAERIREDCDLDPNLVPGAPPAGTH